VGKRPVVAKSRGGRKTFAAEAFAVQTPATSPVVKAPVVKAPVVKAPGKHRAVQASALSRAKLLLRAAALRHVAPALAPRG
jgi:hypothetical protein